MSTAKTPRRRRRPNPPAMTREQRAVADRARLQRLGRFILPRLLAREAALDARLRHLAAIRPSKRTREEAYELGDLIAMWIMRQVHGGAQATYGPATATDSPAT